MKEMIYIPASTLWICMDQITEENSRGRAYCKLFEDCICFADLAEFLLEADRRFDQAGYPQAFQQKQSFGGFRKNKVTGGVRNPRLYLTDQELKSKQGSISTACIVVESRRHSGWQGIYIDSRGKPVRFTSEIELLRKMSSDMCVSA